MMDTNKVDITDSKAISGITKVITIEAKGVIQGGFIVSGIVDHIGETVTKRRILVKTRMSPMKKANFLRKDLYPYFHRLW